MKGNKIMALLWILIAIFLTGLLVWKLKGTSGNNNFIPHISISNGSAGIGIAQAPLLETKVFDATEFNAIDVDLSFESGRIEKSNSNKVEIEIYSSEDNPPTVDIIDNTLKIKSVRSQKPIFESRKVVIKLPEGINVNDCDIRSASGSLHINDFSTESMDAESASGSVHLTNGHYSSLDVKSSSGSVNLNNITADKADLKSQSGSVNCSDCDFLDLEARSTSGSIRFEGKADKIDLQSTSGSVHAQLANALNADSEIQSTSGSVYLKVPANSNLDVKYSVISGTYRNSITGASGKKGSEKVNAGGPKLELRTTSGSIHVDGN